MISSIKSDYVVHLNVFIIRCHVYKCNVNGVNSITFKFYMRIWGMIIFCKQSTLYVGTRISALLWDLGKVRNMGVLKLLIKSCIFLLPVEIMRLAGIDLGMGYPELLPVLAQTQIQLIHHFLLSPLKLIKQLVPT